MSDAYMNDWIDDFNKFLEEEGTTLDNFQTTTGWPGKSNPFYGCKHTDESRKRMSQSAKKRDNTKLRESVAKRWESQVWKLLNPDGELVVVKGSLNQFCKDNGLNRGRMYSVLNHRPRAKSHHGWRAYE